MGLKLPLIVESVGLITSHIVCFLHQFPFNCSMCVTSLKKVPRLPCVPMFPCSDLQRCAAQCCSHQVLISTESLLTITTIHHTPHHTPHTHNTLYYIQHTTQHTTHTTLNTQTQTQTPHYDFTIVLAFRAQLHLHC